MSLSAAQRLRMLALMDIDVYLPRTAASEARSNPCILIRLDRAKSALSPEQKTMLGNILKAMEWSGRFRQDDAQGDRVVLEIAFGIPASGAAEVSVETDAVDRLAADSARKKVLWSRLKAELPRLRAMQP